MTMLVTDPIRYWAVRTPDVSAIVFDGRDRISYRELDEWTDRTAHFLREAGVKPGDRVGIVGANSSEWCVGAIGALKVGAIVAPYNHRFRGPELRYLMENSEPALVLADPAHLELLAQAKPVGSEAVFTSLTAVGDLRNAAAQPFARVDVRPDEAAVIVYTSGTTSNPKGVIFTHRTIFGFIFEYGLTEPAMGQGVKMLFVLGLAGCPGINWHLLQPLAHGGTVFMEPSFDPATALRRIVDERISVVMGVPVIMEQIAALTEFATADLSCIELASVGGARVPAPTLQAWLDKGVVVRQIYGMTELGGTSISNPPDQALSRPESVGNISMFTHHRVIRPDGSDCDAGEPGEIVARGPAVTPGYWRQPEATAEATRGGWFHSGDLGMFDADGYLRMIDRTKDMIISGGYNIAPSEIEKVLYELPAVEEAAVIPVPDEKFGETPAAILKVSSAVSVEEVVSYCDERLAGYKVPRYIVLSEEYLPRMASGKLAKRELREKYAHLPTTHRKVR